MRYTTQLAFVIPIYTILLLCLPTVPVHVKQKSGRVLFRMLGDVMRGSIGVQIWTLCVMTDSTVVSGDSRGQVQLWDGATGVLMDTFRQHSADVLALVVSPGERDIFASGVDGKVVCLQRSQCAEGSGLSAANSTWIYVHAHRAHSHDVFSLAVVPVKRVDSGSDDELVLLSGGVEGRLSTYAVDSFVRVRPTWIPAIPTQSLTSCSHSREVIAVRHSEHVDVWQLQYLKTAAADPPSSSDAVLRPQLGVVATNPNCQLHSRLILKGDHHIHCCGLSPSGDVVALSSASGLRIYQLASMGGKDDDAAREKKILVPSIINAPGEFVQAIAFVDRWVTSQPQHAQHSSSSKKKRRVVSAATVGVGVVTTLMAVYCAKKGCIFVCELSPPPPPTPDDDDAPAVGASGGRLLCSIRSELPHLLSSSSMPIGGGDPLDRAVRKMVFSGPGSDYLAVLSCGSISRVFVYSVGNKQQQQQLHWILPTETQLVTDIAFLCRSTTVETHGHQDLEQQSDPTSLVCVNASNCFHVFDIDQLKLGPEYLVPGSIRDIPGPICGVSVLDRQMIMYGQGYCVFVDLSLLLLPSSAGEGASSDRDSLMRLAPGDASSKLLQSYSSKQTKKQRRGDPSMEEKHGEGGQGDERRGRREDGSFVVFNKYRNLLQVSFKSSNELVRVY